MAISRIVLKLTAFNIEECCYSLTHLLVHGDCGFLCHRNIVSYFTCYMTSTLIITRARMASGKSLKSETFFLEF